MSTSNDSTPSYRCSTCGVEKPLTDEFWHKNKSSRTGYCSTCKACACARARKWSAQNKERSSQQHKRYYREHSEAIKQRSANRRITHATELKVYWQAYHLHNKTKKNAQARANRLRQREKYDRRVKAWIEVHPDRRHAIANRYGKTAKGIAARARRRARERSLPDTFTAEQWQHCLDWWRHKCAYCGATGNLSADHFIPLASPDCPGTIVQNMLPACKRCNSSKMHNEPVAWLAKRLSDYALHEVLAQIAVYFDE